MKQNGPQFVTLSGSCWIFSALIVGFSLNAKAEVRCEAHFLSEKSALAQGPKVQSARQSPFVSQMVQDVLTNQAKEAIDESMIRFKDKELNRAQWNQILDGGFSSKFQVEALKRVLGSIDHLSFSGEQRIHDLIKDVTSEQKLEIFAAALKSIAPYHPRIMNALGDRMSQSSKARPEVDSMVRFYNQYRNLNTPQFKMFKLYLRYADQEIKTDLTWALSYSRKVHINGVDSKDKKRTYTYRALVFEINSDLKLEAAKAAGVFTEDYNEYGLVYPYPINEKLFQAIIDVETQSDLEAFKVDFASGAYNSAPVDPV